MEPESIVAIADLEDSGDLPLGVHRASLVEVLTRLGAGLPQRQVVASRLDRIHAIATATRHVTPFVVFGSFVTETRAPNDVDILIVVDDEFDASRLSGESARLFDHPSADTHFGASVFGFDKWRSWEMSKAW